MNIRALLPTLLFAVYPWAGCRAAAQTPETVDLNHGKQYFQQNCALCHSDSLGAGNTVITKQGPSLVGVFGRRAGLDPGFSYTQALKQSGILWNAGTLDHFLTSPAAAVPGTIMPMPVPKAADRMAVIAYLETLKVPAGVALKVPAVPKSALDAKNDPGSWRNSAPGVKHHITVADLPPPYQTTSSGNAPGVVKQPAGAALSVPPGFTVRQFAAGLWNPRFIQVAPNGDIFIAELAADRLHVMRAADGADAPTINQIFVAGLDRPFGIAFYPRGEHPQWIYVANTNSVVRFPYHDGDLAASGPAQVIVPRIAGGGGAHTTRAVAFSLDGKRMFITVGSASNVAEGMSKKSPEEVRAWEKEHSFGAAWDGETDRADILVTDPEGRQPPRIYATGIRNGAGIAVNEETGDLWAATNERDGLGDNLVPDYVTRVKEGAFYGWPWYYMGKFEDPRHAGERPDLAGRATVPDVLFQSHSAPLELTFYTAKGGVAAFPTEYEGDVFVAMHGSWNRSSRTGYKVVRVRVKNGVPTGEYDDFLTGFVLDEWRVWGRPVGVAVAHDGALLVTEDGNGTVWRIAYHGPRD